MEKFCISAYALTNVGKRRTNNEDNFYLNGKYVDSADEAFCSYEGDKLYCSVCDGMGGEAAGEVASQIAVETIKDYEQAIIYNPSESQIEALVNEANDKICSEMKERKKRIGTTFTLLTIREGKAVISNVGDSRIYRLSDGNLEQISVDHTEVQSMVDAGIVTKEQSMSMKEKHHLTQHFGIFPHEMIIEPYIANYAVKNGDVFLLCSDGLTDMVTEPDIENLLKSSSDPKSAAETLVSKALENGGKDNVTVIVCKISQSDDIVKTDYIENSTAYSRETIIPKEKVSDNFKRKKQWMRNELPQIVQTAQKHPTKVEKFN